MATVICDNDTHTLARPVIGRQCLRLLGHESAGIVQEVGAGVTSAKPAATWSRSSHPDAGGESVRSVMGY